MAKSPKTVVFFHPDLGIGGAERLVVDAAVGLLNLGHKVVIFTSHCDKSHCFDEARDGTLDVRVRGNSIFPPNIAGRFAILCAILRQLHLVVQICLLTSELTNLHPNVLFIDQLSACVPLLRILVFDVRILFYCHFPDKLLTERQSWWKKAYRVPFDWIESYTTGISDGIVVNSKFTRSVFASAFPGLRHRQPGVVYPCVDINKGSSKANGASTRIEKHEPLWKDKKVLLSINRFDRKKGLDLAIKAYAGLSLKTRESTRLVIAGGYDPRVHENVAYHKELAALCASHGLASATAHNLITAQSIPADISVLFLLSVPSALKSTLLATATLLVYTPAFEHFGIVPLEAMLAGVPVLAADSGGPTESVVDGETGWLRDAEDAAAWMDVMRAAVEGTGSGELETMGRRGRRRVRAQFSQEMMALRLEAELEAVMGAGARPSLWPGWWFVGAMGLAGGLLGAYWAVVLAVVWRGWR